jgi:hypothetical protein
MPHWLLTFLLQMKILRIVRSGSLVRPNAHEYVTGYVLHIGADGSAGDNM